MNALTDDDKKSSLPADQKVEELNDDEIIAKEAKALNMPYLSKSVPVFIDVLNVIPEDVARANQIVAFLNLVRGGQTSKGF